MFEGILFYRCWKVSFVILVLKNVREMYVAKSNRHVDLLSVVSLIFDNRLVGNFES